MVATESEIRLPMPVHRPQLVLTEGGEQTHSCEIEPGDIDFAASPLELMRKLRRLYDNSRTTVEERGATTLHLTFGVLDWRDEWLGETISPIWMVPAQLTSKGPNAPLRLTLADEEMQVNPALELYLRERPKVTLPDLPEDHADGTPRLRAPAARSRRIFSARGRRVPDRSPMPSYRDAPSPRRAVAPPRLAQHKSPPRHTYPLVGT